MLERIKKIRLISYFIVLIIVFFLSGTVVFADKNGFIIEEDGFTYYYVNDVAVTGVQQIADNYYYFDENGKMQYGTSDGTYYYGKLSGTRQYNYWWDQDSDGKVDYYFGSDGIMVNGVQQINGQYFYFIDGKMQYGTSDGTYYYGRLSGTRQYNYLWDQNGDGSFDNYFQSDGKKVYSYWLDQDSDGKDDYYFDHEGNAVNNVKKIDDKYYYFVNNAKEYGATDGTYYYGRLSGTRQYNYWWDQDSDGKNDYYFSLDGIMVTGVQQINGQYYYFDESGKMQYATSDGQYYYGRLSGTRQYNYWWDQDKDGRNDYYFGSDGIMVDGVQQINGKYYYFVDNKMQYGTSDGTYYYGKSSGTRQYNYLWDQNGDGSFDNYFQINGKKVYNYWWDQNGDGKLDYYFDLEGNAVDGIQELDGKYYYFVKNIKQYGTSDGIYYYGKSSGTRQYNYWWDQNGDGKSDYYFGLDGVKVTGTQYINGRYYHFNNQGKMEYGVFVQEDGTTHYYGKQTGTRQVGWIVNGGRTYYFEGENGNMVTGKVTIDGVEYEFNADGTWKAGWIVKNNHTYYYYLNGTYATGWVYIAGQKCFFNSQGMLIKQGAKKIIDVSSWQGDIDWDVLWNSGEIDGVIIRTGFSIYGEDEKLSRNIAAVKRLNIPYGIYVYNYAENYYYGTQYGEYLSSVIRKYNMNPTLGIYYDLESNKETANLSPAEYDRVVSGFMDAMRRNGYGSYARVYTYKYLAETSLNTAYIRPLITWIAQYNDICTYSGTYQGWQYTSSGRVPGISGDVDISVF